MRALGLRAGEQGPEVAAIDHAITRRREPGERQQRREQVEVHRRGVQRLARRQRSRPRHQRRHALATLEGLAFAPAQAAGAALMPRPVVAGEDNEGVLAEPACRERAQQLADARVELLDRVAVRPGGRAAREARRGQQRRVYVLVRDVEEERPVAVAVDEADRLAHELGGHVLLREAEIWIDPLFVAPVRVGELVVRVGEAGEEVEAVAPRMVTRVLVEVAEMPFADHAGGVACQLQRLGERDLGGGKTRYGRLSGLREIGGADPGRDPAGEPRESVLQRVAPWLDRKVHSGAQRIAPGEEPRARRRAVHTAGVELREAHALVRQLIQVWRADAAGAERPHVPVAEVVGEDDDDVGARCETAGRRLHHGLHRLRISRRVDVHRGVERRLADRRRPTPAERHGGDGGRERNPCKQQLLHGAHLPGQSLRERRSQDSAAGSDHHEQVEIPPSTGITAPVT